MHAGLTPLNMNISISCSEVTERSSCWWAPAVCLPTYFPLRSVLLQWSQTHSKGLWVKSRTGFQFQPASAWSCIIQWELSGSVFTSHFPWEKVITELKWFSLFVGWSYLWETFRFTSFTWRDRRSELQLSGFRNKFKIIARADYLRTVCVQVEFICFSPEYSGHQHHAEWTAAASSLGGGASEEGVSGHRDAGSRVQGLRRENGRLQEQLRSSEELNSTLRSELNLHRSIMAQTSSHHQDRDRVSEPQEVHRCDITSQRRGGADEPRTMNPGKREVQPRSYHRAAGFSD